MSCRRRKESITVWQAAIGCHRSFAIKPDPHPEVDTARCTGCGRCIAVCRERLLTLEVSGYRKHAVLTISKRCTRCLDCLAACPVAALGYEKDVGKR